MKNIIAVALIAVTAYGIVVAKWTGRSEQFTSVTGRNGIRCEYEAPGMRNFWRSFEGFRCPPYIDIY